MSAGYRLGILGAGAVTTDLYLPALALVPEITVEIIADADPAAAARLTEVGYHGRFVAAPYESFLKALSKSNVDAVVVALPNSMHESAAIASIERGFPVLIEKPLATTRAGCDRVGTAATAAGVVAAAGMVRRLLPSVTALRRALAKNLIGTVQAIVIEDGSYFSWPSNSGAFFRPENGGVLADMGVHYLDLVTDLFGKLKPISYQDDCQGGVEANCDYRLVTERGVSVSLRLSRDRTLQNTFRVKGDLGELILKKEDFARCYWMPSGSGLSAHLEPDDPFPGRAWPNDFVSCFAQQFREFATAVHGEGPVRCTAAEAGNVIGLIEEAYGSRIEKAPASPIDHEAPKIPGGSVVVTGGTGFIGGHLVARLNEVGIRVTAPVRHYRSCVELARHSVAMPKLDILDVESVAAIMRGARWVFHLAYGRDTGTERAVTVDGTRHVVEAAIRAGAEGVLILSSMAVFGHPKTDALVDESWPYSPSFGKYGRTKCDMERWCLARAKTSGKTRIVVLNPTCVYGEHGKTYTRLPAELAKDGCFFWVDEGSGLSNHVYVGNLVDAMMLAIVHPEAHGRRFLVNDGYCTWREFLEPVLGVSASKVTSWSTLQFRQLRQESGRLFDIVRAASESKEVRAAVSRHSFLNWVKTQISPFIHRTKPVGTRSNIEIAANKVPPAWLLDLFGPNQTKFSAESAKQTFGWSPRFSRTEAVRRTQNWLREHGLLQHD